MMRKLVEPFGPNYSPEPVMNNISFAHLDSNFYPIFLTALNCWISVNWKHLKNEIVKALSTLRSAAVWALPPPRLCVWGQCPLEDWFSAAGFTTKFPDKNCNHFLFVYISVSVPTNLHILSIATSYTCFHCLLARNYYNAIYTSFVLKLLVHSRWAWSKYLYKPWLQKRRINKPNYEGNLLKICSILYSFFTEFICAKRLQPASQNLTFWSMKLNWNGHLGPIVSF